ncbi:putative baseplate assembly protein [Actinoplanes sp. GCM10030250]|uniref:putative baseplate assembly protein n=1 Tax=Actinoplanes sp. GCM10030250 TaxID=3273376 RepID=UPI00360E9E5E
MNRRAAIRAAHHNGVDEVEVSDDGLRLTVTFLGRAPDELVPGNVRIDGGRRVTGITAVEASVEHADDPEIDDRLHVTVDRPGDTSRYRLSLVATDEYGRPGTRPYPGLDQRYFGTEFRFWPQLPAPFDPAGPGEGGTPAAPAPVIDYTARDYDTVRRLLLDRLALTIPGWAERNPADLGVTLVELLAYTADQISYQQDAVATEAYLDTARRRVSVRRHVRLIDYPMHDGCNARAVVVVNVAEPVILEPGEYRFATAVPDTTATVITDRDLARLDESGAVEVFEPLDRHPVRLDPDHYAIRFWIWDDEQGVLPAGATAATLRDDRPDPDSHRRALSLRAGDVLVLESAAHRQAVRLETVAPAVDRLTDQPVLEITWSAADALTAPLPLPEAVAHGNTIVVDHGRSVSERLGAPHVLPQWPVTQAVPYPLPEHVRSGQAAHLASIPVRARARLTALWRSAGDRDGLSDAEVDELTALFGLGSREQAELRAEPVRALRDLLHRSARLLAGKRRRLDVLAARARAGTVLRAHIADEIEQSWGQRYAGGLHPGDPVLHGPMSALAGDPRQALPDVTAHLRGRTWTPRRDLLGSGPRDRHFTGELGDDGRLALRFGDGRYGATAPEEKLEVRYRVGGGTAGNVGADTITHLVISHDPGRPDTAGPPVVAVRNPLPAAGGTEPEPVDQVRHLAPLDLTRRRLRAVTAADYAELASALPGVQRAAAELRWTGSVTEAHVAVDAYGTGTPSPQLLDEVAHRLESYRRIGHDLIVEPARAIPLDIVLEVRTVPGHQRGRIAAELHRRLLAAFRPDAVSFGDPVRVSRLTALAAAVRGVRSARITRLRRQFEADAGELAAGLLRLGPLEIAQCDNDPDRPGNGRLVITLIDGGE